MKIFEHINVLRCNSELHVLAIMLTQVVNRHGVSAHMCDILCIPSIADTCCSMQSSNDWAVQRHPSSSNAHCALNHSRQAVST